MSQETRLQRIEKRISERNKPKATMVYADPLHFATHTLGFVPDEWQARVLSWTGKRLLLNCCRQSGKSTTTAVLALHRALHFPKSLILLVSPSLRQSAELFRKVLDFLGLLTIRPALTEDNKLSLQMANGSRIVSLPAKESNVRGFSGPSLIIEDESARVHDDLYLAMRPMLAISGGAHILMSTPFGRRGHFYEAWEHGGDTWDRIMVSASDCPRITPDFLAEERRTMPALWFDSEYRCLFVDTVDQIFSSADIEAAISDDVEPLFLEATWQQ
jgi:Terminase large subunit, T4likevirus-type, N-terminal